MENENKEPQGSDTQESATGPINVWPIASFGFAVFIHIFNNAHMITSASFLAKCFSIIVATVLGTIGAAIGDAVRKFAMPDGILTSGGMGSLIWNKLFWMFGPQVIGMVLGVLIGAVLVLK
ncbi:MAG: hypothetical protein Q7T36_07620 [Fluviicoccus sp.]|uniref:hypothetical protein n=1 Tax=Fluviicoccus sp. TaxID=2003552 RepID=UPI002718CDF1|nr:hypothetical protein [Fluviicoccus sp.]MDO8330321.1 hypothetical protein [Fluviicoccus sp.]